MRAMTSRVEIVRMGCHFEHLKDTATLDFGTLTKYKGNGKCREVHCNYVCIGWIDADDDGHRYRDEKGRGILLMDQGYVYGLKDKWMDDENAEDWAEQMNWDLKVINQDGEYLLSRKNHD